MCSAFRLGCKYVSYLTESQACCANMPTQILVGSLGYVLLLNAKVQQC